MNGVGRSRSSSIISISSNGHRRLSNNNNNNNNNSMKQKKRQIKVGCIAAILLIMYIIFMYLILISFGRSGSNNNTTDHGESEDHAHLLRQSGGKLDDAHSTSLSDRANNSSIAANILLEETKPKLKELTLQDFCGLCHWRGQGFNCNERVDWVVKAKGQTLDEARLANTKYCYHPNGCNDKLNDEGFMDCDEEYAKSPNGPPPDYKMGTMKHVEKTPELEDILSGAQFLDATSHEITIEDAVLGVNQHENEVGLRDRRKGDDIVRSVLTAAKYGDRQYETEDGQSKMFAAKNLANDNGGKPNNMPVLSAYCEPVNQTKWETKPLPPRDGPTIQRNLFQISYPHVQSCKSLSAQWPIDTPPVDLDPYLPWYVRCVVLCSLLLTILHITHYSNVLIMSHTHSHTGYTMFSPLMMVPMSYSWHRIVDDVTMVSGG